jgi:LacI family transcriptional regulator
MPVDEDNSPLEIPRMFTEQHADGLLFVGAVLNETFRTLLQRQSVPVVLVDAYAIDDAYDAVVTDNEGGAYRATNYLIKKGHHRIAIIGSLPHSYPSIHERRVGYLKAMKDHDLSPYFIDCHHYPDEAGPKANEFLQKHSEITAVFACNDDVAIAVMQAAQSLGKHIPKDISVIGFDNIALAQHVTPALTTMRVDKMGMGRLASQLLLNRLEYPESSKVRAVIHPTLIERQSATTISNQ